LKWWKGKKGGGKGIGLPSPSRPYFLFLFVSVFFLLAGFDEVAKRRGDLLYRAWGPNIIVDAPGKSIGAVMVFPSMDSYEVRKSVMLVVVAVMVVEVIVIVVVVVVVIVVRAVGVVVALVSVLLHYCTMSPLSPFSPAVDDERKHSSKGMTIMLPLPSPPPPSLSPFSLQFYGWSCRPPSLPSYRAISTTH